MKVLLGVVLVLTIAGTASADTTWTYTGNVMNGFSFSSGSNFANCGCSLDGTVTLNANYQPVAWDFTDGTHTLTNLDSTMSLNPFYLGSPQTNSPFMRWTMNISGGGIDFLSQKFADPSNYVDEVTTSAGQFGYEAGNPGTWVETPEPTTGILLSVGLLVAGLIRRKQQKPTNTIVWEKLG